MHLSLLEKKLNDFLDVIHFNDDAINGIQVVGKNNVKKVATGVSSSVSLFDKAIKWNADAIIVHHGILWKGMDLKIQSNFKERIKKLLVNDISLLSYHLPLDAHPEIGNNILIGKKLGFNKEMPFGEYKGNLIGYYYNCDISIDELMKRLEKIFGKPLIHIPCKNRKVKKVGIISGGAQKEFPQVIEKKIDCFITGEISEFVVELAKEINCHFISAGHYRTERFGIEALTEKISKWGLDAKFFDLPHIY